MTLLGLSLPGSHPRLCHSLAASDKLVHRGEGHCQTERNQGPCLETKRNSGKAQILTPIKRGRGVGPSQERGGAIQVSSTTMAGFFFCNARHYHVPMLFILCWCLEIRCYKTKLYLLLCWEENSESYGNPPKPWFHWILGSLLILWFWIWSKFLCVLDYTFWGKDSCYITKYMYFDICEQTQIMMHSENTCRSFCLLHGYTCMCK